jgi:AhpD family alkylhydroperoxidase
MQTRFNYRQASPGAYAAMVTLEAHVATSGLEPTLLDLVRVRVSQINGCAYCIDMHTKDARKRGETEQRLYALNAWREAPFFSERERATLAWAEAVTLITGHAVPDALYESARAHFSEQELTDLTLAVVSINGWNRLAISFGLVPGDYHAGSNG